MNEIVGSSVSSLYAKEVLQWLDFDNLVSPNDVDYFISDDFFFVIGFLFCLV